jgi:hypothetical protein
MVIIFCVLSGVMLKISHDFDDMVVLQKCMNMLKIELGSHTETCLTSSGDGNHVFGIKAEEVADIKEEDDPGPTTSAAIKTEPVVSWYVNYTDVARTVWNEM